MYVSFVLSMRRGWAFGFTFGAYILLQQPITNLSTAQSVVLSVQQATAASPNKLSVEDAGRVTTVLDKVRHVLQTSSLAGSSDNVKRQVRLLVGY